MHRSIPEPVRGRQTKPSAAQPGTLAQQLDAVALYLADPARKHCRASAWSLARRLAIPHARACR